MGTETETLRWPTNLDRAAIEQRLIHAREIAVQQGLTEVASLLADVEHKPPSQIAMAVMGTLDWLEHKPELRSYTLQLEMVALNLKNLKS
ncbi:MAG TPA: hypothetical protein VIV54_07665 [Burkholderiales bacterium]